MDKILDVLFDYQLFEQNDRLRAMLDEAESGSGKALSDEELEWVAAAGEILPEEGRR